MFTKLTVADGRGGQWRLGVGGGGYEAAQGQRGHTKVGVLVLVPAELRRKQSERGSRQGKRKREEDAGGTVVGRPGCPDERPARCVSLDATRTRFLSFLTGCATRMSSTPHPHSVLPAHKKTGGIEAIVGAMRLGVDNLTIAQQGMAALGRCGSMDRCTLI